MQFKSVLTIAALFAVAVSGLNVPTTEDMKKIVSSPGIVTGHVGSGGIKINGFMSTGSCEKEDEQDCKEFCGLSEQSATCSANGNKITCSCKGGKAPEQNCEERCLLCMPGKQALDEAKELFKLGGTRVEL